MWTPAYAKGVLEVIDRGAFLVPHKKKGTWEHLSLLGFALEDMFGYKHLNCQELMWKVVLKERKVWQVEKENEEGGSPVKSSAAGAVDRRNENSGAGDVR